MHESSGGVYGQLKVWDELNESGIAVARCTVERLMRARGIVGVGTGEDQEDDPAGREAGGRPRPRQAQLHAPTRPDELWLADFTYIRTWEGWSYLAVVLDVYTRRIVGWQLAPHMRQSLVTDAFEMALSARTGARGRPHRPLRQRRPGRTLPTRGQRRDSGKRATLNPRRWFRSSIPT